MALAIGTLTKQLAAQAIGDQVNSMLDTLRPAEAERAPVGNESTAAVIAGQVQAMQKALKEDQELVVLLTTGVETLRVLEIYVPGPTLLVLTGIDTERNVTRVISAAESLQLVCKVMKARPEAKPVRVNVIMPKKRAEG